MACLFLINEIINEQNKLHENISENTNLDCIVKSNIHQETIKLIKLFLIASQYPVFEIVGIEPSKSRLENNIVENFEENGITPIAIQLNIEYLFDIYAIGVNPNNIFYILNEMINEFEENIEEMEIEEMEIEDKNQMIDIITSIDGFKGLYQIAELYSLIEEGNNVNINNFINMITNVLSVRIID